MESTCCISYSEENDWTDRCYEKMRIYFVFADLYRFNKSGIPFRAGQYAVFSVFRTNYEFLGFDSKTEID